VNTLRFEDVLKFDMLTCWLCASLSSWQCCCMCWQLAELEHRYSLIESENRSLHSRLEGPTPAEKSINVSLCSVVHFTFTVLSFHECRVNYELTNLLRVEMHSSSRSWCWNDTMVLASNAKLMMWTNFNVTLLEANDAHGQFYILLKSRLHVLFLCFSSVTDGCQFYCIA